MSKSEEESQPFGPRGADKHPGKCALAGEQDSCPRQVAGGSTVLIISH